MNVSLSIRFVDRTSTLKGHVRVLCFKHAVQAAVLENSYIEVEIDDFDSEYDGRCTGCTTCESEGVSAERELDEQVVKPGPTRIKGGLFNLKPEEIKELFERVD